MFSSLGAPFVFVIGISICVFYLQHLFFECYMARLIWMIIHATFGLQKSNNVIHMFGTWLQGIKWKERNLILTGVSVVCWAMWLSRNDIVFDNVNPQPCLQILFRATYWIRFWALLRKEDDMNTIPENCQVLESMAMEIFARNGWRFSNRLRL